MESPPDEWPLEIKESYDAIRSLGKGGFASVVLATPKRSTNGNDKKQKEVAIKVVGIINENDGMNVKKQRNQAILYARREIEILKNINHPNIVGLFDQWIANEDEEETKKAGTGSFQKSDLTAAVLVLEYSKGPTVESLLRHGGSLSTIFGRVIIAQAIDAVAFLHCHAVLHRDIKPDNILVTGAYGCDDFIWNNNDNYDDHNETSSSPTDDNKSKRYYEEPNWQLLRSKYKVTLIDFGFARALTPNDVSTPSKEMKREDSQLASYHRIYNNDNNAYKESSSKGSRRKGDDDDGATGDDDDDHGSSHWSTKSKSVRKMIQTGIFDSSIHRSQTSLSTKSDQLGFSSKMKREMSALGNRNYAAPEIINKVHPKLRPRTDVKLGTISSSSDTAATTGTTTTASVAAATETISSYVADYGLLVDAYSMGHTIRYMMTGCQPGIDIEDAIWLQNGGCIGQLFSLCCKKSSSSNDSAGNNNKQPNKQRSVRYRRMEELPADVKKIIGSMTQISEQKRLSIRKARWNVPWIADVLCDQNDDIDDDNSPQTRDNFRISYLPFTTAGTADEKPVERHTNNNKEPDRIDESPIYF